MKAKEIKIVLVDSHPLTRLGVRMSFENFGPSCRVVAEADTVFGAKRQSEQHPDSDLLLLDILLPDDTGIELVQYAKESYPRMKVLIFFPKSQNTPCSGCLILVLRVL